MLSSEKDICMMLSKSAAAAPLVALASLAALEGVGGWRRDLARAEPAPGGSG